jgi:hypothetical protein
VLSLLIVIIAVAAIMGLAGVAAPGVFTKVIITTAFIRAVRGEDHFHYDASARDHPISIHISGAKGQAISSLEQLTITQRVAVAVIRAPIVGAAVVGFGVAGMVIPAAGVSVAIAGVIGGTGQLCVAVRIMVVRGRSRTSI